MADHSSSGRFCIFFLLAQYLDLTQCDCLLSLKRTRTFPSTVFSTYKIEEIWQLAHGAQQRCCPSYRWKKNTARGRIDFTRHSQLLRMYCSQFESASAKSLRLLLPTTTTTTSPVLLAMSQGSKPADVLAVCNTVSV